MISEDFLGLGQKTLLITGASSGIGKETAIRASRYGARVALLARRATVLEEVVTELHGSGHLVVPYDLSNTEGISGVVRGVAQDLGGLDGLVHSAGTHQVSSLRSIRTADIQGMLDLNVTAALMLAKGFRQKQVRKPSASLVFLSSAVGLVGQSGVSAYSAAKGALVTVTKSLALELSREDIRVNCVCPGIVRTEMTKGLQEQIGAKSFQTVSDAHPLGLGEPSDVANAILFLLSNSSRWITGSSLVVDGGYTAK
ncbi:SDR family NAD(P)-dependent oxidoreductase [Parafrigoribacterium humi]|uniref:SDR family NAD(P)-dependent oxidoreductase n=1 Tax=Parafrigoribacterium humi TaxID=3144664 RepID=UPI0032ECD07A